MKVKKVLSIMALLGSVFGSSESFANPVEEWTALKTPSSFQIEARPTVATYYVKSDSGWGAPGCPSAQWAYIWSDRQGGKEVYNSALLAREFGRNVRFYGVCDVSSTSGVPSNYFRIVMIGE